MTAFPWLDRVVQDAQAIPAPALAYLASRGVTADAAAQARVGYVPSEYQVASCSLEFAEWQRWYLRDRLIFPMAHPIAGVYGLSSRSLAEKKYQVHYAGHRDIYPPMLGFAEAADLMFERQQVVVVEGVFDLFAVRSAGVMNAIALLTSHTNKVVNQMLARYVKRVIALLDMDDAGRSGVGSFLRSGAFEVLTPIYPANDPADLVQLSGGREFLTALLKPATQPYGLWL